MDIFRTHFLQPLKDTLDALPDTVVMLIPSVRDLVHDHAVFPQAELSADIVNDPVRSLLARYLAYSSLSSEYLSSRIRRDSP